MSLNKEIIFGLSSLGGDDMYAYLEIEKNKAISGNSNEFILPEPTTSFSMRVKHALWMNGNITVYTPDGEQLHYEAFELDTGQPDFTWGVNGLVPKGTKIVLKITSYNGSITPTVSYNKLKFYKISPEFLGGVRVSSYHIVSLKRKSKRKNLCH
jgi:hypothetical protein